MSHPSKTLLADPVVYYKAGNPQGHVAFVIKTHDDDPHMACLVFYCPVSHGWFEAYNVKFGPPVTDESDRDYFVNQGDCTVDDA